MPLWACAENGWLEGTHRPERGDNGRGELHSSYQKKGYAWKKKREGGCGCVNAADVGGVWG